MFPNRFLISLGACFLAASAAWANDVGYIDCSNHSEDTQVFEKARMSRDVVSSLPCGERFTILVYGFVFSRIQTRDGKIGYIYSSLIAVDRSAASTLQSASARTPVYRQSTPETAAVAQPNPPAPAQNQPASVQSVPAQAAQGQMSAPASNVPETPATFAQPNPAAPAQNQPASVQSVPAQRAQGQVSAPASNVLETPAAVVQPGPPAAAQPQPAKAEPAPAPAQPAPAEAAAPAIRPADSIPSWERPRPSARVAPRMEVYGGYAFARLVSGGVGTNLNGALGSFGYNIKPWLQIVGDTSYSFVTTGNTKNVLYGNHYGPRFYRRGRNRWGATPFVEALVGGSRADTTVSGVGGYTTSQNTFSYKVGGGLDIHPSRRWDIRLFDADYYRTSFGTNVHQNNYWISTGVVLRLLGGGSE